MDYDHRERDMRIESQPDFALNLTQQMRVQLEQLPLGVLDTQVRRAARSATRTAIRP